MTNQIKLADPFKRIAAYLIDSVLYAIPVTLISLATKNLVSKGIVSNIDKITSVEQVFPELLSIAKQIVFNPVMIGSNLLDALIAILIFVIIPMYVFQSQTIGKKLLGIKIMNLDGSESSRYAIFKRQSIIGGLYLISAIPVIGLGVVCLSLIILTASMLMLFLDANKQVVWDKFANTSVFDINK